MVQPARLCDVRAAAPLALASEENRAEEDESKEARTDDIGLQVIVGFVGCYPPK